MPTQGNLITATMAYDGGRDVTVYAPPELPQAVVFAGDGQLISQWGGVLEAGGPPPTMIVGGHRLANETLRHHEYSPCFDPERFVAHEPFFVEDVPRWVQRRFGVAMTVDRTAICGVSSSGQLAFAIGLRHPDAYGAIFCASPGGATDRPLTCRIRFLGPTSSPARASRSSSRTRLGGRTRGAGRVRTS
jgi:pimeloyl-ACP methyl ester carboxylesterase